MQLCMKALLLPQLYLQHICCMPYGHHARELRFHPLEPCFQLDSFLLKAVLFLLHFRHWWGSYPAFFLHVFAERRIFCFYAYAVATYYTNQCLHRLAGLMTAHIRRCGNWIPAFSFHLLYVVEEGGKWRIQVTREQQKISELNEISNIENPYQSVCL